MKRIQKRRGPSGLGIVALLCAASLGGGCAVAAIAGSALVISDEFQDNAQAAQFPTTPEFAWATSLYSLSQMTTALIHRDDDHMTAETRVDYGVVRVMVREVSPGITEVRVNGEKAMLYSPELSRLVLDRIELDLNHMRDASEPLGPVGTIARAERAIGVQPVSAALPPASRSSRSTILSSQRRTPRPGEFDRYAEDGQ